MKCQKNRTAKRSVMKGVSKPTVERIGTFVPPLVHSPDGDSELSLLVEKRRCGRVQKVRDGEIFTVRLGMHNQSTEVGAFARDTVAACFIPTVVSRRHRIMAFFGQRENFPTTFMDDVILCANMPVKLEYVKGSAALECNCDNRKTRLDDSAVAMLEERLMITTSGLNKNLPECYTYTYDFITFQIRITQEQDYYVQKQVRIFGQGKEIWHDSVTAKVGNKLEFRVIFANSSDLAPEVMITDKLPGCLKFVKGEAYTYNINGADDERMEANEIVSEGLKIRDCAPDAKVVVYYTVEVIGSPLADGMDRVWDWSNICVGQRIFEDYAEVIIK